MSHWIPIYQFPLDRDLADLAHFIRRHRLPLRITEENNCQVLSGPDSQLAELLLPLLRRWDAGEIDLATVRLEPIDTRDAEASGAVSREVEEQDSGELGELPLAGWPLRKTPLSLVLIAVCFIGWLLRHYGLVDGLLIYPDPRADFQLASSSLAWHWAQGEYWRLWTPAVVHLSLPHALFNALGIWILGRPLEARAGTLLFALLVFVSAAVANLAQYCWSPEIQFGGMSGVVYALVGAVFLLQRWVPGWRELPAGLVPLALGWLLLCASGLVTYVIGTGIANAAHIGGFICGLLLALIYCLAGGAHQFIGKPASG
ncbi:GlpG protein [Microbulbifer thermotolerans]|uniref:rhomboid family intramembrane serine protease n=1 Tax=Microbulbifer thermotolerans TaxID=252514 RepID=UPI0008E9A91B|nr:rhomboid family intramembrane serine protease [Microbulbifer thermotolerans]SFD02446.1 GlpG protein [Microbulbifer thermotolerans]